VSAIVLDASALVAMLRDEVGGRMVARAIVGARMSAVNLGEVVSHFIHAGMPSDEVDAMLAPLPLVVISADAALARAAGRLRKVTARAGLSLGDRFCLALAASDRLPAWTADRQWSLLSVQVGVEVVIIR
jgi:ribonuclease VapC